MKLRITLVLLYSSSIFLSCDKEKEAVSLTSDYFDAISKEFEGSVALETTAFVEQFWRIAGNTGFNKTVYRISEQLEKAGYVLEENASPEDRFTYRIEKRAMDRPTWEPVDASLTIAGEDQPLLSYASNRNMIYQYSNSTPLQGITAEVVHIETLEDLKTKPLKGKIVYTEMSAYRLYTSAIIEGGAIGLLTYNNPAYLQPEKNVTSIQFRSIPYVKDVPIDSWGIALSYEANEQLKSAFAKGSVTVDVAIETKIYPSEELTIVANVKGSELPKESLVFSAHIQEPGANDNATGVGTQLEMAMLTAKLVQTNTIEAKRTLTFLWGDEIISTRRYIEEKEKRTAAINWGISLDMVGENTAITGGTFLIEKMPDPSAIWTRGTDKHSEWGGEQLALEDMKPHYLNDFIINIFKEQGERAHWEVQTNPFEGGSDHTPFLRADIPGLLLWHFTDQFYHTDNDRLDKVSQETMQNVGTAALVSAYVLINADEHTGAQLVTQILTAAKTRLTAEFQLSKTAIAQGEPQADELQILEAWTDWYLKTLDTVKDVTPQSNKDLDTRISDAKTALRTFSNDLIQKMTVSP